MTNRDQMTSRPNGLAELPKPALAPWAVEANRAARKPECDRSQINAQAYPPGLEISFLQCPKPKEILSCFGVRETVEAVAL